MTTTRDITEGLQRRSFGHLEAREDADGKREVAGVGVPYNKPIDFYGIREQFAPGAVDPDADVKLFWRHAEPIGKVLEHHDTDEGWQHRARISETPRGDEAYTLAKDGVIDKFSVGFEPIEHTETKQDDGSTLITHTKVRLREVSLVPFPAYDDAQLTSVRDDGRDNTHTPVYTADRKDTTMPDTTTDAADLEDLRSAVDDLNRRVEMGLTPPEPGESGPLTRSFGEFVARLAAGDEEVTRAYEDAMQERAYSGGTSADAILTDQWVGSLVDIIHQRQTVASTFQRGALPAKGLTVEYAVLDSDTTQVTEQENEGDDLAFGKVSISTETAKVHTLGGYTTMSRQEIERTENVSILDVAFSAMAEKYGRGVESLARASLKTYLESSSVNTVTGDLTSADNIVAALIDLAEKFDDNGLSLNGLFLDKDSFKTLAKVAEDRKALQMTTAPDNKQGTVSVNTLSASLSNIPVRLLPNVSYTPDGGTATTSLALAYDASAMRTLESAGAPVRLQDSNIINLSQDFSVYGYAASFVQRPSGLVVLAAS